MKRVGKSGEFRSNLHRGGRAEAAELSDEERVTAIQSAATLGLNVSGVDMLRSRRGPVVMEVNSSPGLEGVEAATGIDVATEIIAFLEAHAQPGRTETRGGMQKESSPLDLMQSQPSVSPSSRKTPSGRDRGQLQRRRSNRCSAL